jgi:hypothetical protein
MVLIEFELTTVFVAEQARARWLHNPTYDSRLLAGSCGLSDKIVNTESSESTKTLLKSRWREGADSMHLAGDGPRWQSSASLQSGPIVFARNTFHTGRAACL